MHLPEAAVLAIHPSNVGIACNWLIVCTMWAITLRAILLAEIWYGCASIMGHIEELCAMCTFLIHNSTKHYTSRYAGVHFCLAKSQHSIISSSRHCHDVQRAAGAASAYATKSAEDVFSARLRRCSTPGLAAVFAALSAVQLFQVKGFPQQFLTKSAVERRMLHVISLSTPTVCPTHLAIECCHTASSPQKSWKS